MNDSILESIKLKIGMLGPYDPNFDGQIIDYINSIFFILHQVGYGPEEGFYIKDDTAVWTDFMPENVELNGAKTYIFQRTQLIFDPPQNSSLLQALKESIAEFEWRLGIVGADHIPVEEV